MTIAAAPNPHVLRFMAFVFAEGIAEALRSPEEDRVTAQARAGRRRALQDDAAPFLTEREIDRAGAVCLATLMRVVDLMPEFSGDIFMAWEAKGVAGVSECFGALGRELRLEIARALMRIVGADDG